MKALFALVLIISGCRHPKYGAEGCPNDYSTNYGQGSEGLKFHAYADYRAEDGACHYVLRPW